MARFIFNYPETGVCPHPLSWGRLYLPSMRTGAAGALAAKYLVKRDSKVIGMVGAETQAMIQLQGL
jgi:alanine dehydrogenase